MYLKRKEAYNPCSPRHDDWLNIFADMGHYLTVLGLEEEVHVELQEAIEELEELSAADNSALQEPIDADGEPNQEDSKACTGDDHSIHFVCPTYLSEHPERPAGSRPLPSVMSQTASEQAGRYDMWYHAVDYERFREEESARKDAALADARDRVHRANLGEPLNGHSIGLLLDVLPLKEECAEVDPIPTLQSWRLSSDATTIKGSAFGDSPAPGSLQIDNGSVSFALDPSINRVTLQEGSWVTSSDNIAYRLGLP